MRTWKVTEKTPSGTARVWKCAPWTIALMMSDGSSLYQLWKDGKAMPELWAENLEDAMGAAKMLEDNVKVTG